MGYTSLGAAASVNHLHLQLWRFDMEEKMEAAKKLGAAVAAITAAVRGRSVSGASGGASASKWGLTEIVPEGGQDSAAAKLGARLPIEVAADATAPRGVRAQKAAVTSRLLPVGKGGRGWAVAAIVFERTEAATRKALTNAVAACVAALRAKNMPHTMLISGHGRRVILIPRSWNSGTRGKLLPSMEAGFPELSGQIIVGEKADLIGATEEKIEAELKRWGVAQATVQAIADQCGAGSSGAAVAAARAFGR